MTVALVSGVTCAAARDVVAAMTAVIDSVTRTPVVILFTSINIVVLLGVAHSALPWMIRGGLNVLYVNPAHFWGQSQLGG